MLDLAVLPVGLNTSGIVIRSIVRPTAVLIAVLVVDEIVPGLVVGTVPPAVDLGHLVALVVQATHPGESQAPFQGLEHEPALPTLTM